MRTFKEDLNTEFHNIDRKWLRYFLIIILVIPLLINNIIVYIIMAINNTFEYTLNRAWKGKRPTHRDIIKKMYE